MKVQQIFKIVTLPSYLVLLTLVLEVRVVVDSGSLFLLRLRLGGRSARLGFGLASTLFRSTVVAVVLLQKGK